jgi:ribosomal protein L19E
VSTIIFRFTVAEFLLSAISINSYIIPVSTGNSKQVIRYLIKERQVCDMAKSDSAGGLIKNEHVYQRKGRDN